MGTEAVEGRERALETGHLLSPNRLQPPHLLVGDRTAALVAGRSDRLELFAHPTCADAQLDAATRQVVEGADDLRREQWMPVRQHEHMCAEANAAGPACEETKTGPRVQGGVGCWRRETAGGGVWVG